LLSLFFLFGQGAKGLPKAVKTLRAWRGSKRSTSLELPAVDETNFEGLP